jgi:hypothetical protein
LFPFDSSLKNNQQIAPLPSCDKIWIVHVPTVPNLRHVIALFRQEVEMAL